MRALVLPIDAQLRDRVLRIEVLTGWDYALIQSTVLSLRRSRGSTERSRRRRATRDAWVGCYR